MSRKTKTRAPAEIAQAAEPDAVPYPRVSPYVSPTTALVVQALRQNRAEGGLEYAKAELIAALAGCLLYSIELDGVAATLALLSDAASIVDLGFRDAVPSPASRVH